ncbi:MAG: phage tail tape measure protein, partial [Candidatus Gastranaerophilaceae bacterium]
MSDLKLKFEINANDNVSKTLTQVSNTSKSELTKVAKSSEKVNKEFTKTSETIKKVSIVSKDELTKVSIEAKKLENEFKKLNISLDKIGDSFQSFGKKTMVAGTALSAFGVVNVKTAADFEQGMNNISTLIDTNTESLSNMSKEVLKIGKSSPKAISDLTDGLYSIRSAGIEASDQFKVLKGSEMLSVAGLSSTAEAVDIATSAINAFNLKGKEGDRIYDMFFKVVKYGKTNISEFAQGFGQTAGVVAAAKVPLDEYSASVAAMTTSGLKASIAHTQIKAAIAGLSRGTKEQMAVFNKLGAKSFSDLVEKSGGMVNAFNRINKATDGNQAKLIQLVGSVEAYNAILSLTGANNKTYLQTLNDMRYGGDALSKAYQKQTQGFNNQLAILRNSLQKISIDMGNSLMPMFTKFVSGVQTFSNTLDIMPDSVKSLAAISVASLGTILFSVGSLSFATGTLLKSVESVKSGYGFLFNFLSGRKGVLLNFIGNTAELKGTELVLSRVLESTKKFGNFSGGKAVLQTLISDFTILGQKRIKAVQLGFIGAKDGISAFFKAIPSNSLNTLNGIKNFFVKMPSNSIAGFQTALTAISNFSIKSFVSSLLTGLKAFGTFSLGILTNPVTLAITGIAVGALLIVKYWKPITAFFQGMFRGIQEGLAPLQPTFTAIGQAVKPIVDCVKNLFTPINTDGKKAESWGYKFGKGIAWAITKVIEAVGWVKNLLTLGGRIKFGNKGALTITEVEKPDGSHANGLTRV